MSKLSFAIGIPTINRADLLAEYLPMYIKDFPNTRIFVFDNGQQQAPKMGSKNGFVLTGPTNGFISWFYENIVWVCPEKNIGVAASWNILCEIIFKQHQYAMINNDDVYPGTDMQYHIQEVVDQRHHFVKGYHEDWCQFLIAKNTFKAIGNFDAEFFPAYFEDCDYTYRMKLAGIRITETAWLNPMIHRTSSSADMDRSLLDNYPKNKQRYIDKWGGLPGAEKYKRPFNSAV